MNINFQTIAGQKNRQDSILSGMEAEGRTVSGPSRSGQISRVGYAVNLDGSGFTDNAYSEHQRSLEDVKEMAQGTDMRLQHNYMALLSNTLSGEDYAKALEDGFDIKDMQEGEAVTIVDKIKAVLLEAGVEVQGYNDDLSHEKLKKITGSETMAGALEKSFAENDIPLTQENVSEAKTAVMQVKDIENLDDSAVKFMVLNNMEPTIENIYFAAHSTNGRDTVGRGYYAQEGGYLAKTSESYDFEQLTPQIDKVISEAGLDESDNAPKENAMWMVKQGIPLTPEKLLQVTTIKNMEFPAKEETLAGAVSGAIADGKRAVEGNLADPESNLQKEIRSKLVLEETRLKMTIEAGRRLLESGFEIDTAPIEDVIEGLKNMLKGMDDESAGRAVDEITNVESAGREFAMSFTMTRVNLIKEGPADVVGELAGEFESASLFKISTSAEKLTNRFRQANEGYEKLMTAPRADLGDSIKKAFRNVDEILRDTDEAVTEDSRRAVRILGYNRMEINRDSIEKVMAWDSKLQNVVSRLKPGAVLDLIREGKNPLAMSLDELSENLDQQGEKDNNSKDREKYARFLYKLEHKGEITEEEKKSFIGIYRLFHTLKATDYEAIGSVLKTDKKMTIGNLLDATRNQRAARKGMDVTVDESFGGMETGKSSAPRIDDQINSAFIYYKSKAEYVYENLEPEKLLKASPTPDTLLPELAESMKDEEADIETVRAFIREEVRQIRQTASLRAAEPALQELKSVDMAVTFNNLEAMINVRRDRRNGHIWDRTEKFGETMFLKEKLDEEDYAENYLKILGDISDKLSEELETENDTYIDVRAISLLQKQISVMRKSAESSSFEVPVEIDGSKLSMHVTLKSEKSVSTRMDASVQTDEYGLITLSIFREAGEFRGMLTTTNYSSQEETEYLEKVRTRLCDNIGSRMPEAALNSEKIAILYHAQGSLSQRGVVNADAMDGREKLKTDTKTLLTMAKAFIEAL